jgi:hypothetical protein
LIAENQEDTDEYVYENNFIDVNIVNCKVRASSCGQCLEKQLIDLGCGWCRTTNSCSLKKDCPSMSRQLVTASSVSLAAYQSNWMHDLSGIGSNGYCSDPKVFEMSPKCGPKLGGGTQLVLNGENLGHTPFDVKVKMKSLTGFLRLNSQSGYSNNENEIECSLVNDKYVKSSRIVCKTRPILSANKHDSYSFSVYVHTNTLYSASVYSSFNQSNQFVYKFVVRIDSFANFLKFYLFITTNLRGIS